MTDEAPKAEEAPEIEEAPEEAPKRAPKRKAPVKRAEPAAKKIRAGGYVIKDGRWVLEKKRGG